MNAALPLLPKRFVIDVARYYRMAEAGVFADHARVELIEGDVLTMSPTGSAHAFAVDVLVQLLAPAHARGVAHVSSQRTLRLSSISAPEPDVVLLKGPTLRWRSELPAPADVLLLIEVAESSLAYDSGPKLALYASHGVAEVWIVDLAGRRLVAHRGPRSDGRYAASRIFAPHELLAPQALPEEAIRWAECLGDSPSRPNTQ